MSIEYQLPQLSLGSSEATLVRWLKQPGERLAPGDPLLIAANDCVEIAFPTLVEGTIEALLAAEGAPVTVGASIARIATAPVDLSDESRAEDRDAAPGERETIAHPREAHRRATPVARRIAAASKLNLTAMNGSGPGGRILKADVLAYFSNRQALTLDGEDKQPGQQADISQATHQTESDTSILKSQFSVLNSVSPMRRAIAAHMVRSRATSPHALTAMEVDMGQVAAARAHARDSRTARHRSHLHRLHRSGCRRGAAAPSAAEQLLE
jgi:pyruvate/2-oxoglutarate dehydrogenase complex dihydrolipoamide acyltransferase (E2) component